MPIHATPLEWGLFLALIFGLLAADLGIVHRHGREAGLGESIFWSVLWTALALAFGWWLGATFGKRPGLEFLTGYVVERALSFDNLLLFVVLFRYFAVPRQEQHRVLFWGVLGALATRGLFVGLGSVLLRRFGSLFLLFGAFLVWSGIAVLRDPDKQIEPERSRALRLFRRLMPLSPYHGNRFFVRLDGKLHATPLALTLVAIEATDVVFAVDSIPAVFGITRDPFIVFTSNIFAILGLRALYFPIAALVDRFHYLRYALGLVLAFVGAKMLVQPWYDLSTGLSLGVVLALLAGSIALSLLRPRPASPPPPSPPA
ncbi:MAG: TerC family protein [Acidobacteriota bacterium]|nr:TerC family protein [Acidobacteriota bacterium]